MDFDFLPDGCSVRATVIGAVLALFAFSAFILAGAFGGDLLAIYQGTAPGPNQPGNGGPAGPGTGVGGSQFSQISDRYFTSGSAQATVSGAFQFSGDIEIDTDASYVQDDLAWISFIDNGNPGAGEVLVVFNEPENSVTVAQGPIHAIGQDAACTFNVHVTESTVAGSIACASVQVLNGTEPAGTSSINLQFSTNSVPMDHGSGDPGGAVETPTGNGG